MSLCGCPNTPNADLSTHNVRRAPTKCPPDVRRPLAALRHQSYFSLSRLFDTLSNPTILTTRRAFGLGGTFLVSWLLGVFLATSGPAWSLGSLKTNRRPLCRLMISRTTSALPYARLLAACCSPDYSAPSWLRGALLIARRPPSN